MANNAYAWFRYAELQQRSKNVQDLTDYAWGIESALNLLLTALEMDTVPASPEALDAELERAIASGARLCRSRSAALKKWVFPSELISTHSAAEANIELARVEGAVNFSDGKVLLDVGLGYTDREIADRHVSTPGAIRARLYRLRLKLTTQRRSEPRPAAGATSGETASKSISFHSQPRKRIA